MRLLIGIDDTDNADTRGTGYRARRLGSRLEELGLAQVEGITRHQLLVDPRIPYTSHNSSACLVVAARQATPGALIDLCRDFLLHESAPGADAGLCLAPWSAVGPALREFGYAAKQQVLDFGAAVNLARREEIFLEGLTGDGGGVIGALAALGLRAGGQDGRFIWLKGLRELSGVYTAAELIQTYHIGRIAGPDGTPVPPEARVDVGSWRRPILQDGRAVLLVEPVEEPDSCDFRVAPKEVVKQY